MLIFILVDSYECSGNVLVCDIDPVINDADYDSFSSISFLPHRCHIHIIPRILSIILNIIRDVN